MRPDGQPADAGDRVAGVGGEVGQELVHLIRIDADPPRVGAGRPHQLDIFADQAAQHAERRPDRVVQVEHSGGHQLATGEAEELAGDPGGPRRGRFDSFEIQAHGTGRVAGEQRQFDVPGDDAQHVVEVVGDSAGEAAHRLHLLRLRQLLLQPDALQLGGLPFGDVLGAAHGAHGMARVALVSEERLRPHLQPAQLAVRPDEAILDVVEPVRLRRVRAPDGLDNPRSIVGVDPQHAVGAIGARMPRERLVDGEAGDAPKLGRPIAFVGEVIVVEDTDVGDANRLVEPLLAAAQAVLGQFACRDLAHDRLSRDDAAVGRAHRLHDRAEPPRLAVHVEVILGAQRLAAVDHAADAGAVALGDGRRKQLVHRPALDLFGLEPENRGRGAIDVEEPPSGVGAEDRIVRRFDERSIALLALAQRLLGPRPVAHVAERGDEPGNGRGGILDARNRAGDRKAEAVTGHTHRLPRPVRVDIHRGQRIGGRDEPRQQPATDVGGALVAPQPHERVVDEGDAAFDVREHDGVDARLDRLRHEVQSLGVRQTGRSVGPV